MTGETAAVTVRPVQTEDEPFVRELFASAHGEQFGPLGLAPEALAPLLAMQFDAREVAYRRRHPEATADIIEIDGVAAGRMMVDRAGADIHLLDIALLPAHRGHGVGSMLLRALQDEARREGRTLTLTAARDSRPAALYLRLGFAPAGGDEVYVVLRWPGGVT